MSKRVLSEAHLYIGDNGRVFCGKVRCAGMSAAYSGYTLGGQRVRPASPETRDEFLREIGQDMACEQCHMTMGQGCEAGPHDCMEWLNPVASDGPGEYDVYCGACHSRVGQLGLDLDFIRKRGRL